MAKKVRVVVDSNDIFYEGLHDAATKQKVMKSALWPVAIALYSHCEKDIRIGPVHYSNDDQYVFHFMTPSGFSVAALTFNLGSIRVMTADRPLTANDSAWTNAYSTRLDTNNVRYAVSKLGPSSFHDVKSCMSQSLNNARNVMNEIMRESLTNIFRVVSEGVSDKPTISINRSLSTTLVRIVMGNEDRSLIPQGDLKEIETLYNDYLKKVERFRATVSRAKNMFTSDKWVIFPNSLGGVVVGAITKQPMLAACDLYERDGNFPGETSFSYLDRVVPFKWYKNYNSIPEEIRQELDLSLLMLKTHTNSPNQFPDTQSMFEAWESIEAFTMQDYYTGNTRMFVMSK